MLARLDEIPGVAESRVDWTGRRFLLSLEPGARESLVAREATSALGEGAYALDGEATRAALDAFRRGEAWMRAGETLCLSRHEAGVLAERYGEEAAREIGLGEGARRKLVALFERELNRAFERTHAGESGAGVMAEIEQAGERILGSSEAFLDAEQRAALEAYLKNFAGPRGARARAEKGPASGTLNTERLSALAGLRSSSTPRPARNAATRSGPAA